MKYYVIYKYPKDYPDHYVVRMFTMQGDGSVLPSHEFDNGFNLAETLTQARDHIPSGLVCVPADKKDDPVIVETWL